MPHTMPLELTRAFTLLLVALASFMTAAHALLFGLAAQRTKLGTRARVAAPLVAAAFLGLWLGVAFTLADQTNFPLAQPSSALPISLAVLLLPMAIAVAALYGSRTLAELNAAMPPTWLIRM